MISIKKDIVLAVDGYSSCGKSSFAKLLAKELDYTYIDSGAMYRAVAYFALKNNLVEDQKINQEGLIGRLDEIKIEFQKQQSELITVLNGVNIEKEIRGVEVSQIVSEVSKLKEVRTLLVKLQQEMGQGKGIVMDGRDIGTVVFPHAEIKLFMTADVDVRAKRRFDELVQKGIPASYEEIHANVVQRDHNDLNRDVSPLKQAEDAVVLDNSHMTFEQQLEWFEGVLKEKGLLD